MRLWSLDPIKSEVRMPEFCDKDFIEKFTAVGFSPAKFKGLLDQLGNPLCLRIIDGHGRVRKKDCANLDFAFLSWVPFFSIRAYEFCISIGLRESDFVRCEFDLASRVSYYMYLPDPSNDVLDVDRCKFAHLVPLQPPFPFHLERAVFKRQLTEIPTCFRIPIPGRPGEVMKEVLVNDEFKERWSGLELYAGEFREIPF